MTLSSIVVGIIITNFFYSYKLAHFYGELFIDSISCLLNDSVVRQLDLFLGSLLIFQAFRLAAFHAHFMVS